MNVASRHTYGSQQHSTASMLQRSAAPSLTARAALSLPPLQRVDWSATMGTAFKVFPEWETSFHAYPVQLYCLLLGAFASLVAPFGGFFGAAQHSAAQHSKP